MIENLNLLLPSEAGGNPVVFRPAPMNVFVGPNNSGKSLALNEIAAAISGSREPRLIVEEVELSPPDPAFVQAFWEFEIGRHERRRNPRFTESEWLEKLPLELPFDRAFSLRSTGVPLRITASEIRAAWDDHAMQRKYLHAALSSQTLYLLPQDRLNILVDTAGGDLQEVLPDNLLHSLFRDSAGRERIRIVTQDAFNSNFVVDPTGMATFRARLHPRPPADAREEESLTETARTYHGSGRLLSEFSSGVRAFTGVVAVTNVGATRVILLDEAEAFLHPPLAAKLGRLLTTNAWEQNRIIFAATHSPDFLMGCVQAGLPVNVVRMTYSGDIGRATLLPAQELGRIMRDPLLRSTGVLSALFHPGAVICEGASDRIFYDEVNHRLRATGGEARDVLFLNAVNKQTVQTIIAPLRRLGIPAAAVVDLDIVKESDLASLLRAARMPDPLVEAALRLRTHIRDAFHHLGVDPKCGGISSLSPEDRTLAARLLRDTADYGVFIVPVGELERWLPTLGVKANKSRWIEQVFEAMRTDPTDPEYLRPGDGDVWEFVRSIGRWIGDPNRLGT
jgi:energy-coupling factor transporter ATP-binding protein EcfA2